MALSIITACIIDPSIMAAAEIKMGPPSRSRAGTTNCKVNLGCGKGYVHALCMIASEGTWRRSVFVCIYESGACVCENMRFLILFEPC